MTKKDNFLLVKKYIPGQGIGLFPAYESDLEKIKRLSSGIAYSFSKEDPRNVRHHRKMFAIFRAVRDTKEGEIFPDEEAVLTWVKWHAGYVSPLEIRGKTIFKVQSISFEKMGQARFDKFYTKAVELLAYFIGCTPQELEAGAFDYM